MGNLKFKHLIYVLLPIILITIILIHFCSHETNSRWRKFGGNPVLGGKLGTVFDVSVMKEGDVYRMWFSWRTKKSIALTESKDGINWSSPTIVLKPDHTTGWEESVNRPVVLKRSNEYHMWYTGRNEKNSFIGYAISPDGVNWTRVSKKPVLTPEMPWEKDAVMVPCVIWNEKKHLYMMWYSGGEQYEPDAIGYATSPDGVNWTKNLEPVFRPSKNGSGWDSYKVTGAQVLFLDDRYVMFYIGFRDIHHAMIGIAYSPDGVSNWKRYPANPIIKPGIYGSWDHDAVYRPFVIRDNEKWYLWYNGRRGDKEQIGLAIHEGADLGSNQAN